MQQVIFWHLGYKSWAYNLKLYTWSHMVYTLTHGYFKTQQVSETNEVGKHNIYYG